MQHVFNLFDQYPAIPIGIMLLFVAIALMRLRGRKSPQSQPKLRMSGGLLGAVLFWWTERGDPFRVRDLLDGGGLLVIGRSGSGKTSSSGRFTAQKIVDNPRSGGMVLLPKPGDIGMWTEIFRKSGRMKDVIVFGPESGMRCNFFGCLKRPRDVVQFVTTMSEVMKRGDSKGGGDNNRFYDAQEERTIYNAVAALQGAGEPITAPNLHRFIMTAPTTPAEMQAPEWQAKYHSQVLERGFKAKKPPLEEHDFLLCIDFWLKEWGGMMDVKTRGNILAGVQGTLHVMNTGLVRQMASGETNFSPYDMFDGKWILCNFPPSKWGAAGLLLSTGLKQLGELAILERETSEKSAFVTLWADEAHQYITSSDVHYIVQCRSHMGCLVYLSQSISSFYSAMKGEAGKHQAEALIGQFATVIAHVCDPVSAKWLSEKLGRRKEILYGGSSSQGEETTVWDQLYGRQNVTGSFSEHMEPVLEDSAFMVGRTGGPDNDMLCDAWVLRSGVPFADGNNHKRVTFSQKG